MAIISVEYVKLIARKLLNLIAAEQVNLIPKAR